jgi:hypothetical protein
LESPYAISGKTGWQGFATMAESKLDAEIAFDFRESEHRKNLQPPPSQILMLKSPRVVFERQA